MAVPAHHALQNARAATCSFLSAGLVVALACDPAPQATTVPDTAPAPEADHVPVDPEPPEAAVEDPIHDVELRSKWIGFHHPSNWQVTEDPKSGLTQIFGTIDEEAAVRFIVLVTHGASTIELSKWSRVLDALATQKFEANLRYRADQVADQTREVLGKVTESEIRIAELSQASGVMGFRIEHRLIRLKDRSIALRLQLPEFLEYELEEKIDRWLASITVPDPQTP